ncbi:hypothetical protein LG634_36720 [Streptomyces bambusae]|uniref:hypothetical protein n=1 Tax=Streptomyces bambusae TaxID=1550616 RepID=UPI001CFF57D2|nr:hypothetical protein [Streptomyces bambusae]MCB5170326.1 hypothetical protein [Streptomyces bambusae]
MVVETLGSALLGLALAWLALRRLPGRLPSAPAVLATGTLGAAFGGYLTHYVLGPGHTTVTASLVGGALVAAVVLSLLLRPAPTAARHRPFSVPSGG